MGELVPGSYLSDSGIRYPIKGAPDGNTLRVLGSFRNNFANSGVWSPVGIVASPGRFVSGFLCRYVVVRFLGSAPSGYKPRGFHKIIVYRGAVMASIKSTTGQLRYLTHPVRLVSAIDERSS